MTDQDGLKEVYAGHTISANYIKEMLEQNDIGAIIKTSNQENFITGTSEGTMADFDRVMVTEEDFEKASVIVADLKASQK